MSALKVKALGRRPRRRMSSNCVHGARTSSHPLLNTTARAPESPASHKLEATTPTTNACDTAPRGKVHHCSEGVCASRAALSMAGHCLLERGAHKVVGECRLASVRAPANQRREGADAGLHTMPLLHVQPQSAQEACSDLSRHAAIVCRTPAPANQPQRDHLDSTCR